MFDPNKINGKTSDEAIKIMQEWLEKNNLGKKKESYRLRDWLISRQRYWGTPIPIVYCENCGIVPIPEDQLPVLLPENVKEWQPKGGVSPLSTVDKWVNTYCPNCGSPAKRETDTMDTFVDSSWYFLRYPSMVYKNKLKQYDVVYISQPIISEDEKKLIEEVLGDLVNNLYFFEYETLVTGEAIIAGFEKLLNEIGKKVIVISRGIGAKTLAYFDHEKIVKEIIILDDIQLKEFYELELHDLPLEKTIFITNFKSEILEKSSYDYKYKYFLLSGDDPEFKDNLDEFKDILQFSILEVENKEPWFKNITELWLPVDNYVGGIEHATMHLLYARFFTKALNKLGYLDFDEPFQNLFNQGMIYYKGAKMSKSKGNVVNPDELVEKYGTDSVRAYILFMGPPQQDVEWSDHGIVGVYRWIRKIYNLYEKVEDKVDDNIKNDQLIQLNKTIKKIKDDVLLRWQPNTAIASMMEFTNFLSKFDKIDLEVFIDFLRLLSPFTPFISEYLYYKLKEDFKEKLSNDLIKDSIFLLGWPDYNTNLIKEEQINLPVQFNGKLRGTIKVSKNISQEEVMNLIKSDKKLSRYLPEKINKIIYIPGKIINILG